MVPVNVFPVQQQKEKSHNIKKLHKYNSQGNMKIMYLLWTMRIQQQTKNNFNWKNCNNEIIKLRPLTLHTTVAKCLEKETLHWGSYAFENLPALSFITDDTSKHNAVLAHKHEYIKCLNIGKLS